MKLIKNNRKSDFLYYCEMELIVYGGFFLKLSGFIKISNNDSRNGVVLNAVFVFGFRRHQNSVNTRRSGDVL